MLEYLIARFGLLADEDGQTAVEYALVLVLVAIVLAGSLAALSGALDDVVLEIRTALGV